jgi:hypothetical protein
MKKSAVGTNALGSDDFSVGRYIHVQLGFLKVL